MEAGPQGVAPVSDEAAPDIDGPRRPSNVTRYLFVIGIILYSVIVWYIGWQKVRDELLSANLGLVLLAAGIIFSATWVRTLKWRYALGPGHGAIGLFFMSKATGNWSPGRLGEFAPMFLRRHRTPKIGAWIMLDRILEIFVTLALGLVGLYIVNVLAPEAYVAILVTCILGGAGGVYLLTRRGIFLSLAERTRETSIVHRFAMLFAAINEELYIFSRKLVPVTVVTVLTKCADLWAVVLIFRSFGYAPGFALVAAAKCALAIVSFFPVTPAATGVPHVTQAWLMNYAAGIPYEGLAVGIGVEVVIIGVTFWTSVGLAAAHVKDAAF